MLVFRTAYWIALSGDSPFLTCFNWYSGSPHLKISHAHSALVSAQSIRWRWGQSNRYAHQQRFNETLVAKKIIYKILRKPRLNQWSIRQWTENGLKEAHSMQIICKSDLTSKLKTNPSKISARSNLSQNTYKRTPHVTGSKHYRQQVFRSIEGKLRDKG